MILGVSLVITFNFNLLELKVRGLPNVKEMEWEYILAQLPFKCFLERARLAASVWFHSIMLLVSVLVFIFCIVLVTIADYRYFQEGVTLVSQNQADRKM